VGHGGDGFRCSQFSSRKLAPNAWGSDMLYLAAWIDGPTRLGSGHVSGSAHDEAFHLLSNVKQPKNSQRLVGGEYAISDPRDISNEVASARWVFIQALQRKW